MRRPTLTTLRADPLRALAALVAVVTIVSGLGQLLLPGVVLDVLGAESTPTTRHFFAIVGMFMAVVGGVTAQAVVAEPTPPYVVLWAAVQKAGAVTAVTVGVARDLFSPLALAVAAFDLVSTLVVVAFWLRLRGRAPALLDRVPA